MENLYIDKDILLYDFVESTIASHLEIKKYNNLNPYVFCIPKEGEKINGQYVQNKFSYKISVDSDGLYRLTIYDLGFESTDPIFVKNKKVGISLKELEGIVEDLSTLSNLDKRSNLLTTVAVENIQDAKFIGCNVSKFIEISDCHDELVAGVIKSYNIYIKNDKLGLIMIEAFTSNGMCGSGWTTASWGTINAHLIKELPEVFEYTAANKDSEFEICFTSDDSYGDDSYTYIKLDGEEILSVSDNGGDCYYPSGGVSFNGDEASVLVKNPSYQINSDIYSDPEFDLVEYNAKLNQGNQRDDDYF